METLGCEQAEAMHAIMHFTHWERLKEHGSNFLIEFKSNKKKPDAML